MLSIQKHIITFLSLLLICSVVIISCSKGNSPVTDDTVNPPEPIDDGTPVGFQGEIDWVKTFGGSNIDQAVAIVKSDDNAYVVVGTTNSIDGDITDKTTTDSDYWILKISEIGELIWNRTFGGSNDDVATNISKTSDGGYIVSGYSRSNDGDVSGNAGFHDYWILKLDANGNKVWDKTFGFSGSDQAFDVFQTKDGGYFVKSLRP